MPEQEPVEGPEGPSEEEREAKEPSYTRDEVLEAMAVGMWPRLRTSDDDALVARREGLVARARDLLNKYQLGTEPDFEYLAEALEFAWNEKIDPELLTMRGKPAEEVLQRKAELTETAAEREAQFVKQAYERLLERQRLRGG